MSHEHRNGTGRCDNCEHVVSYTHSVTNGAVSWVCLPLVEIATIKLRRERLARAIFLLRRQLHQIGPRDLFAGSQAASLPPAPPEGALECSVRAGNRVGCHDRFKYLEGSQSGKHPRKSLRENVLAGLSWACFQSSVAVKKHRLIACQSHAIGR